MTSEDLNRSAFKKVVDSDEVPALGRDDPTVICGGNKGKMEPSNGQQSASSKSAIAKNRGMSQTGSPSRSEALKDFVAPMAPNKV